MLRVNECTVCLKVLISDRLMICICTCAPQMRRSAEEKNLFLGSDAQCDMKHTGIGVDCCWRGSQW